MTVLPHARCGVCTRIHAVRVDGSMREHRSPDRQRVCQGSGGPPRYTRLALHLATLHRKELETTALSDDDLATLEGLHDELHRRGDFGCFSHDRENLWRNP
ncbi:MAG: hypothetical protein M0010_15215 [Actinomycetota bacterium]|jgi:hypothetical protein|nr:hypothetical protein [Actinomycetota bacterium]